MRIGALAHFRSHDFRRGRLQSSKKRGGTGSTPAFAGNYTAGRPIRRNRRCRQDFIRLQESGMTELLTSHVELNVADGTTMRAYVARPKDQAARAGLLVFQEAFGVNSHIRDVTERFAREGYSAIAPELFHRTAPGF